MRLLALTILLAVFFGVPAGVLPHPTASPNPEQPPRRPLVCVVFPSLPICQPIHDPTPQPIEIEPMPCH